MKILTEAWLVIPSNLPEFLEMLCMSGDPIKGRFLVGPVSTKDLGEYILVWADININTVPIVWEKLRQFAYYKPLPKGKRVEVKTPHSSALPPLATIKIVDDGKSNIDVTRK